MHFLAKGWCSIQDGILIKSGAVLARIRYVLINTKKIIIFPLQLGLRFGNKRDTFLEFKKRFKKGFKKRSDFGVEFKTTESEGIIFYIADEKNSDFIALFVKNGKLIYGFNCGSGPIYIESPQSINDGE